MSGVKVDEEIQNYIQMELIESLEQFQISEDNWVEYVERIEQYFVANGIIDNAKKRAGLFWCLIDRHGY